MCAYEFVIQHISVLLHKMCVCVCGVYAVEANNKICECVLVQLFRQMKNILSFCVFITFVCSHKFTVLLSQLQREEAIFAFQTDATSSLALI